MALCGVSEQRNCVNRQGLGGPVGAKPDPEQGGALHPQEEKFLEFPPTARGLFGVSSEEKTGREESHTCCYVGGRGFL